MPLEVQLAIGRGAVLCCLLAACAEGKPTIGVSIQNLHSEFYGGLYEGLRSHADMYHYSLLVRHAGDEAEQQSQVEEFIRRRVAAIVIVPVDSKMVGSAILEANAAEIPVFTSDINSTSIDSNVQAYVASNNREGGAKAARLMCEGLPKRGLVAIIDQPEVSSVRDRVNAFRWAIKHTRPCAKRRISVVTDVDIGVRHKGAQTATAETTADHRDLAGIFFVNDESLLAAFPKLDSRKPCSTPILVGYDAIQAIQREIDRGVVYGDARQYPQTLGSTTVDTINKYLRWINRQHRFVKIDVGTYGPYPCVKGIPRAS
jgi:ribose transport system substrate-binding protein